MNKLTPKGDRVLIEMINESTGGIILPEELTAAEMEQRKGKVVSLPEEEAIASELNIGDTVLFSNYGVDVKVGGKNLRLVHFEYILGVIEE